MSTTITTEGNLTSDPELRYTSTGKAVTTLRVAVTARRKNANGDYQDTPTHYYDAVCWGPLAEHAVDTTHKGTRVLVHGATHDEQWSDRDGNTRTKHTIQVQALGVSLRYHTATVHRASSTSGVGEEPADSEVTGAE